MDFIQIESNPDVYNIIFSEDSNTVWFLPE